MAVVVHRTSGIVMGDPDQRLFPRGYHPRRMERIAAARTLIRSASGWRKVFAPSGEEGREANPSAADLELTVCCAGVFARFLKNRLAAHGASRQPVVAVALDTRPTGPALADAMIRTFMGLGCGVIHPFIAAAPELMAWMAEDKEADGFAYISASHNPIGHNGFKFGLSDGGVLDGEKAAALIKDFGAAIGDDELVQDWIEAAQRVQPSALRAVLQTSTQVKERTTRAYRTFVDRVVAADEAGFAERLRASVGRHGCGIVIDFNGSARAHGIDRSLLESFGLRVQAINERAIVHRIVPEGESLRPCALELDRLAAGDAEWTFGYVPDADGDRGNIVFYDSVNRTARALEAQEVFALCCVAEFAHLDRLGRLEGRRAAVVVNDPTSMRIEAIAAVFGVEVHRVEVGEANVVQKARCLREAGCEVRILGEGSNGGNITHPSAVRDPIVTVIALLKLIYLDCDAAGRSQLLNIWRSRAGRAGLTAEDSLGRPGLGRVIASLPRFSTLGAYEPSAVLHVRCEDHRLLKERYERIFQEQWQRRRERLAEWGIADWEEMNYEGTHARRGFGPSFRSGSHRGGLRILLLRDNGHPCASIWMRGSATEAVFRVLADVEGDRPDLLDYLVEWQRGMIQSADAECAS